MTLSILIWLPLVISLVAAVFPRDLVGSGGDGADIRIHFEKLRRQRGGHREISQRDMHLILVGNRREAFCNLGRTRRGDR